MRIISLLIICLATGSCTSKKWDQETFKVWGNCEMCKETIEGSLKIRPVQMAVWDVDTKMMTVRFDAEHITLDSIQKRIALAGYDSEKFRCANKGLSNMNVCPNLVFKMLSLETDCVLT